MTKLTEENGFYRSARELSCDEIEFREILKEFRENFENLRASGSLGAHSVIYNGWHNSYMDYEDFGDEDEREEHEAQCAYLSKGMGMGPNS